MRPLPPHVPEGPRQDLLACVRQNPGIHLRGVERRTGLPLGQVLYHLDRLERMGLIVTHRDRGFRRYFASGTVSRQEKPILSALRHDVPRRLVLALLDQPGLTHKVLQRGARVAGSTLSFHLQRLVGSGVLVRLREEGQTTYALAQPDLVRRELVAHGSSLEDPEVDAFLARDRDAGAVRLQPQPRSEAEVDVEVAPADAAAG